MKLLFDRRDIERFGFTYEPNEKKCNNIKLSGNFHNLDDQNYIAGRVISKYINSIYENNGNVYVRGHGTIDFI